jgi:transcriptional regulator with XRE-family HTH domain
MQPNDLAEAIRRAIRASGKSAGQLSAASMVAKAVITRFLRDERSITVETADKLLAALGCEIEVRGPGAEGPPAKAEAKQRRGSKGKPSDRPAKG